MSFSLNQAIGAARDQPGFFEIGMAEFHEPIFRRSFAKRGAFGTFLGSDTRYIAET